MISLLYHYDELSYHCGGFDTTTDILHQNAQVINGILNNHHIYNNSITTSCSFRADFGKLIPEEIMTDLAHEITQLQNQAFTSHSTSIPNPRSMANLQALAIKTDVT